MPRSCCNIFETFKLQCPAPLSQASISLLLLENTCPSIHDRSNKKKDFGRPSYFCEEPLCSIGGNRPVLALWQWTTWQPLRSIVGARACPRPAEVISFVGLHIPRKNHIHPCGPFKVSEPHPQRNQATHLLPAHLQFFAARADHRRRK